MNINFSGMDPGMNTAMQLQAQVDQLVQNESQSLEQNVSLNSETPMIQDSTSLSPAALQDPSSLGGTDAIAESTFQSAESLQQEASQIGEAVPNTESSGSFLGSIGNFIGGLFGI